MEMGETTAPPIAVAKNMDVKSLTVKISNCETWRSPPLPQNDEESFEWPLGWVEVIRSSPDDDHSSKTREYHPPFADGKREVFHTVAEVKKYLNQNSSTDKIESSSPRRYAARRRANPNPQTSTWNSSNIGTVDALNKIMKLDNSLSQRMRHSIMIAAVLCRKRKEPYTQFLAADEKVYPDLRSAFKHVGVKQCELCKQRVQGAFYCRIAHEHLDVPDYDGGSSYVCIRDFFKSTVDDLVQKQDELLYGEGGSRKRRAMESSTYAFQSSDDNATSMDLMSGEVMLQIALFIPTFHDLISFCKTSKRMQKLLYTSVHSDMLFSALFLKTFGRRGIIGNFEVNLSWVERWRMIYGLRRGIALQHSSRTISQNDIRQNVHHSRQTIGVLSNAEEESALLYDNPELDFNGDSCNGYFGLQILHLPPPPNAPDDWQPPVVCHGDFNGIKIFNSIDALFQDTQHHFVSLGDGEGGAQVLALLQCDPLKSSEQPNESRPSFFLGFASGRVAAVKVSVADCGQKYNFCISGFNDTHDQEVTSLAFVECHVNGSGEKFNILFSACCGGQVYRYPNALSPENNFCMRPILDRNSLSHSPIFSMASTIIDDGGDTISLLCIGDSNGKIKVIKRVSQLLESPHPVRMVTVIDTVQVKQAAPRTGLVTRMKFVHNNLLVTCTNNGDLRIWKLGLHKKKNGMTEPHLELKYDKMNLHNGAIEAINNVGNTLLTSGGSDGKVSAINLDSGLILRRMDCHPGRRMQLRDGRTQVAKSCVVDNIVSGKEGCMISLCRDGTLQRWNFR